MTLPRYTQIPTDGSCYCHVVSRCVRQAWLIGNDPTTGVAVEHRKEWVVDRIKELTQCFCIDIAAYAIMSNHYHLVVFINRDVSTSITDDEVVKRWTTMHKEDLLVKEYLSGNKEVEELAKAKINLWRSRLCDLSWFMKSLNEHIARRANREDGSKGRFWEGRFKSQALLDERGLLAAMAYVDLNPVRAKIASHISDSYHTSAYERLNQPISSAKNGKTGNKLMCFRTHHDQKNCLPFSHKAYVELLDWSGRQVRSDKPGYIHEKQPTLVDLHRFSEGQWVEICLNLSSEIHGAIGCPDNVIKFRSAKGYKRKKPSKSVFRLFA